MMALVQSAHAQRSGVHVSVAAAAALRARGRQEKVAMFRTLNLGRMAAVAGAALLTSTILVADYRSPGVAPGAAQANPLLVPSPLPFRAPPFEMIKDADFQPALEEGMRQHLAEANAIAENPAPPTFENTLAALEKSGQTLT